MRRGLIKWDPEELPVEALRQRVQRLQHAMADGGLDAIILYTNFIRCAAVSWLTGFSPYWGDGIVVVEPHAEPLLSTMLSKRMEGWIQGVMPAAKVTTSPAPGKIAAQRLAAARARRIGILEEDHFPSGLYSDLVAGLPDAQFCDGSAAFAQARIPADATEQRSLAQADAIATDALTQLKSDLPETAGEAAARVERHARMAAAEEIYVAIAADLDRSQTFLRLSGGRPLGRRFAVRATVAYKGSWVRRITTYSSDPMDLLAIRRAEAWCSELLSTGNGVPAGIAEGPGTLISWSTEAPVGTRPLDIVEASTAGPLVLTVKLDIAGLPWCGAGLMRK